MSLLRYPHIVELQSKDWLRTELTTFMRTANVNYEFVKDKQNQWYTTEWMPLSAAADPSAAEPTEPAADKGATIFF